MKPNPASRKAHPPAIDRRRLRRVFERLLAHHGPQHWWPHDGHPFEIMIGAVLTQNTAWTNVEKAIERLRRARALTARRILALPQGELAELIRPSGYYNIKADRLQHLCRWYQEGGGFQVLNEWDTATLRRSLLAVKGVGPETCDDILLYAFERPVFVVDAYTFRLFQRLGLIEEGHRYESLRAAVETAIGPHTAFFNELHALVVRHCSGTCKPRPLCQSCPLRRQCAYNRQLVAQPR